MILCWQIPLDSIYFIAIFFLQSMREANGGTYVEDIKMADMIKNTDRKKAHKEDKMQGKIWLGDPRGNVTALLSHPRLPALTPPTPLLSAPTQISEPASSTTRRSSSTPSTR